MTIKPASQSEYNVVDWIPTGLHSLDRILGGGIPTKRITEISGAWSVGKTTLALTIIKHAQEEGYKTLWADIEWSWDNRYATTLGVATESLSLLQNRIAEEALDEIESYAERERNSVIVIDAIGALLPRAEAEKGAEGKTIGGQAGMVAKFCRKIIPLLAINNHALIVLNHEFLDIMNHGKLKTSGGAKLEYHKSIWLRLRKVSKKIMQGDQQIGEIIEAEIRKHKLAATVKQTTELSMIFGSGFSEEADLLQQLLDSGEVVKKGQSYFRGETLLGRGLNKAREALKS